MKEGDSAIGMWGDWNQVDEPEPYGHSPTFEMGAAWLDDCSLIEDWGCGKGWFSTLIDPERYCGVDATSPFAAVTADLTEYRSEVPGIFMRGVIEHNLRWREVLDNALASFTERMALVLFTPTRQIAWVDPPGVPDMSFALADLEVAIIAVGARLAKHTTLDSPNTAYGIETILYIERP
jgi:hypothetical protein